MGEKGTRDVQIKQEQMNKLSAQSDSALFARLGAEIKALSDEIQEGDERMAAATELRQKEKAENTATIKDAAEAVEALGAAIGTLNEFYTRSVSGAKTEAANPIISILETSMMDFETVKAETESAESSASS